MIGYTGEDVEKGELSYIDGGNANLYIHFGNQYGSFSENWESAYLSIHQYHSWPYTQKMLNHTTKIFICSTMFIAALIVITRIWKKHRYPPTDEWIKKVWHISTLEYNAAVKINGNLNFSGK